MAATANDQPAEDRDQAAPAPISRRSRLEAELAEAEAAAAALQAAIAGPQANLEKAKFAAAEFENRRATLHRRLEREGKRVSPRIDRLAQELAAAVTAATHRFDELNLKIRKAMAAHAEAVEALRQLGLMGE